MKNLLTVLVLSLISSSVQANEITFVASQREFSRALKNKEHIQGLAVSVNFYKNSLPAMQKEIDGLVQIVLRSKHYPTFLYGQPFDHKLAAQLLSVGGKVEDGSGCTPTAWAGIILLESGGPGKMCGADDKPRNEQNFRKWILNYWKDAKAIFLKNK